MRASSPAWRRSACSITSGAEAHTPRQILRPLASTTQIAVVFCDTAKPTKWVIDQPPMVETTGPQRPDHGTIGQSARTAITRRPHMRHCPAETLLGLDGHARRIFLAL